MRHVFKSPHVLISRCAVWASIHIDDQAGEGVSQRSHERIGRHGRNGIEQQGQNRGALYVPFDGSGQSLVRTLNGRGTEPPSALSGGGRFVPGQPFPCASPSNLMRL